MTPTTELVDKRESHALVTADDPQALTMFERLASDPNTSVEKIERLMALWERVEARKSEGLFNAAMSGAQNEMRPIAADASNPQTRSRYASYAALDRALRPIYTNHGFALSFNTGDAPITDYVRVLCDVTHLGGHVRTYHVDMPADGKGAKGGDVMTKTHAVGSALSYGMRYLLKMIFNVAVGEDDDDGNAAGRQKPAIEVKAPAGFSDWWDDMVAAADNGLKALETAWTNSKPDHRRHVLATNKAGWEGLKRKAAGVRS